MKKTSLLLSFSAIFLAGLFFASCSSEKNLIVEKRHYGNGYYIHRAGSNRNETVLQNISVRTSAEKTILPAKENFVSANNVVETKENSILASHTASKQNSESTKKSKSKFFAEQKETVTTDKNAPAKQKEKIQPIKNNRNSGPSGGDINPIILVILAILISPLAVYLKEGATKRFWIDLICWLLGIGVVIVIYFGSFLVLFAIIYAILIVLDVI